MDPIVDLKTILDILAGKTLTNERAAELAKAFIFYDEALNWSNMRIAEKVMADIKTMMRDRIKTGAEQVERTKNEAAIVVIGDAAISDL